MATDTTHDPPHRGDTPTDAVTSADDAKDDAPDDRSTARRMMLLAGACIAFALLVVAAFYVAREEAAPKTGSPATSAPGGLPHVDVNLGIGNQEPTPAPDFRIEDFAGRKVSLDDFRGKPLVLNFWASWCAPCRNEMPAFDALHSRLSGQVGFLGIATQDREAAAAAFAEEIGVGYPLAFDAGDEVGAAYGLFGMPSTYFIDAEGQVVEARFGELSSAELTEIITTLFPDVKAEK
ncbi:MAG: TlpA family protein disulfide reductase [Acidimicrobiia bacterium]|nr:TlpA family protein disulfide reductase [Acidimicrobiia bacterium]